MRKRVKERRDKTAAPPGLAVYSAYGVQFINQTGDEMRAECPVCQREKFYIHVENGLCNCKHGCDLRNPIDFIRWLWDASCLATGMKDYLPLCNHRSIENPETLEQWGLCKSVLTGEWLVPAYTLEWKLQQLYRYVQNRKRTLLLPMSGLRHGLFGLGPLYKPAATAHYVCEGLWDGLRFWELMKKHRKKLFSTSNVYAVPSCSVFRREWCALFARGTVNLLYDNDLPKDKSPPAAWEGLKRVAALLKNSPDPPKKIQYLSWNGNTLDCNYSPELKDGYDLSDLLAPLN